MPITLEARANGRILHIIMADPWTITELKRTIAQVRACFDCASQEIHTLLDVRWLWLIPPNTLQQIQHNLVLDHPHNGELVIVGGTQPLRMLTEFVFKLARYDRARFFDAEDDAWTYLEQLIVAGDEPAALPG